MGIRFWIWIFLFLPGLFGFVPGLVDLWPRIWRDLLQGKRSRRRGRRRKGRSLNKSCSLDRENDRAGGQKSSLKELLATTRMADFSTVFILKPKFFCENHTRQKLFYISSYVKFLVKIILIVIETRPKHGLCSCNKSAAYSYQFNNICRTINSSQKENREITTGKIWQHPKLTSNPALNKVESDAKWKD